MTASGTITQNVDTPSNNFATLILLLDIVMEIMSELQELTLELE
jgi:hypothetical protein